MPMAATSSYSLASLQSSISNTAKFLFSINSFEGNLKYNDLRLDYLTLSTNPLQVVRFILDKIAQIDSAGSIFATLTTEAELHHRCKVISKVWPDPTQRPRTFCGLQTFVRAGWVC